MVGNCGDPVYYMRIYRHKVYIGNTKIDKKVDPYKGSLSFNPLLILCTGF